VPNQNHTKLVIVGLGNFPARYRMTRHNMGHLCIDWLDTVFSRALNQEVGAFQSNAINDYRCFQLPPLVPSTPLFSKYVQFDSIPVQELYLVKPRSLMNLSGDAVSHFLKSQRLSPKQLLLIFDDASLPFGELHLSSNKAPSGHHGLSHVLNAFPLRERSNISRLRVGIGPVPPGLNITHYVLENFSAAEQSQMNNLRIRIALMVSSWLKYTPASLAYNIFFQGERRRYLESLPSDLSPKPHVS
jgi:PTH1 family peptidyl-tRNA hydrolase